jgi:hypothetical protein
MTTPVTTSDEASRVLEPGDGRSRHEQDVDLPPVLIFAVTLAEVFVFTRGGHTAHRF